MTTDETTARDRADLDKARAFAAKTLQPQDDMTWKWINRLADEIEQLRTLAGAPDVTAELDHAVRLRPATEGRPEDGPYPTSVGEVADEVVTWIRDHEQYAAHLGEQVRTRLAGAPDVASDRAAIERVRALADHDLDYRSEVHVAVAEQIRRALDGDTIEEER